MEVAVSDPQQPLYGPAFDPNAGDDGQTDPNATTDVAYLVPTPQVACTPPSFNQDPPERRRKRSAGRPERARLRADPGGSGVHARRGATDAGAARTVVGDYEALRSKVMSVKDGLRAAGDRQGGPRGTERGRRQQLQRAGAGVRQEETVPSPIHDVANQFAAKMNPVQEKVLWEIANTVEVIGQYIVAINRSGQTYGRADRLSVFPHPPTGQS
ncbi:hypothetical protein GCM10023195_05320 [Actinoallomurus liliacearum]|uniref:Uncharacterized protein n=1 Tax=Actinoallomurus liliacearum TaxID=1080073 RepID=A0ABP8TEU8_9ACTN